MSWVDAHAIAWVPYVTAWPMCHADHFGLHCTRPARHGGRHAATGTRQTRGCPVFEVWSDQ